MDIQKYRITINTQNKSTPAKIYEMVLNSSLVSQYMITIYITIDKLSNNSLINLGAPIYLSSGSLFLNKIGNFN